MNLTMINKITGSVLLIRRLIFSQRNQRPSDLPDILMQSRRLIFDKKSKFDTAFEGESVENLYLCRQINRNLTAQ